MKIKVSKVSEWIAAGGLGSGLFLAEKVANETAKAVGFNATQFNSFGNLKAATCWLPKSQLQKVQNDYYTDGAAYMYAIPAWLFDKKRADGFDRIG